MKKLLCMCLITSIFMSVMSFGTALAAGVVETEVEKKVETVYDFTTLGTDGVNELISSGEIVVTGRADSNRTVNENGMALSIVDNKNLLAGTPVNLYQWDGSGDYTAVTKVDVAITKKSTYSHQHYVHTGFAIYADNDNYLFFGVGAQDGKRAVVQSKQNGIVVLPEGASDSVKFAWTEIGKTAADQGDMWLKIEKKGNAYTCSFSLDGTTYTPVLENYVFSAETANIGIYSGSQNSSDGIKGEYKTLTITRPVKKVETVYDFTTLGTDGVNELISSGEIVVTGRADSNRTVNENGMALSMVDNKNLLAGTPVNLYQWDGSGDYTAVTKVDVAITKKSTYSHQHYVHTGFAIYADNDNYLFFGVGAQDGKRAVVQSKQNGIVVLPEGASDSVKFAWTEIGKTAADQGDMWLKIEKKGNAYTCSFSLDGTTYTPVLENYVFSAETANIGIYSGSQNSSDGIKGEYKTLTITRPVKEVKVDSVSVESDGAIKATVNSNYETTCAVLFATYNADGMVDLEIKQNVRLVVGENDFTTEELKKSGTESVKVFVWNSIANLVPMCIPGEL